MEKDLIRIKMQMRRCRRSDNWISGPDLNAKCCFPNTNISHHHDLELAFLLLLLDHDDRFFVWLSEKALVRINQGEEAEDGMDEITTNCP